MMKPIANENALRFTAVDRLAGATTPAKTSPECFG